MMRDLDDPTVTMDGSSLGVGDTIVLPGQEISPLHAVETRQALGANVLGTMRRELDASYGEKLEVAETDPRAQAALGWLNQDAPALGDYGYLPATEQLNVVGRGVSITTQENPVDIPVASIVRVPDMKSWDDDANKDAAYIRAQIKRRKLPWERNKPQKPITGMARVYVQPNGKTFVTMINNGAHTVCIARGAGLETVSLSGTVDFVSIDTDIYP